MLQISSKQLRLQIEEFLEQGQWSRAHLHLGDLWRREPKPTTAGYVLSSYSRLKEHLPLMQQRMYFLRSMTIEPLIPIVESAALAAGIDLATQVGQFNAYAQEILDPGSDLYSFAPDIVVLMVQTRDLLPEVWERSCDLSSAEIAAATDHVIEALRQWISVFRSRTSASLIVHTFEQPLPSSGILGHQISGGQLAAIDRLNCELRRICGEHRGVYMLEYDALTAKHGRVRWHDEAKWLTMRMPFAIDSMYPMASEWLKFIHPLSGAVCKVLAVDLDNTLWGGVLGEDGQSGLLVGGEYPGVCYRALQRVMLDLYHRGILLAICSKNDHDEAMSALRDLPEMLLRPDHFVSVRINWRDKCDNLREIARELNVGTDAIVFLDDNPVERERVRTALLDVKVLDLPDHPQGFATALRECPLFERLSLSSEDRERARLYSEQRTRTDLAAHADSLQDFYRSLGQEILIANATPEAIARIAQLTQKTNQFNVTTRRYSERQIEELISRPDWDVYSIRVKDRYGDNGVVGVLITRTASRICEIDSFVLSCRVIGRTIETAVLGYLAEATRLRGTRFLQGWFVPTAKNAPVRELYPTHRFERIESQAGATCWRLNLDETVIAQPEWIQVRVSNQIWTAEQARA